MIGDQSLPSANRDYISAYVLRLAMTVPGPAFGRPEEAPAGIRSGHRA
jgi:hypothetical protein